MQRKLTDALLFGELEHGGTAFVDVKDGELAFRYEAKKAMVDIEIN